MTQRDTLAHDSQFSSLGLRYTRFWISLIIVLKPQNALTCGYLCKSVHLTTLPMPNIVFSSCLAVLYLILGNFYFLCTMFFFKLTSCHYYIKTHTKKTKLVSPGWVSSILWILLSNGSTELHFWKGSFKINRFISPVIFSCSHLVFLYTTM